MNTLLFCFLMMACSTLTNAQTGANLTRNIIYLGGGRQGLSYAKYERMVYYRNWTQTVVNAGYGGMPSDPENGNPRTNKFMFECAQLIGFKQFFVELGLEPSINFHGSTSYIDLNGIIGLRYQSRTGDLSGLFLQAGYNPHVYITREEKVDIPLYFGMGINF